MLLKLSIENYVLIHSLEVDIQRGFSVITGETGSGKSIFLGALGLILGQRADTGVLLDKTKKCIVEGLFSIDGYHLEDFFKVNDLDFDNQVTLRREINQFGKSRAFINDTPVNLSVLKELGDKLVNIHSQHSIITLNDADFQLAVLDSYAANQPLLHSYRSTYKRWNTIKKLWGELHDKSERFKEEQDYIEFLYNELAAANLQPDEQRFLEEKLELLNHAEEIKNALERARVALTGEEENVIELLNSALNVLNTIQKYNTSIKEIVERLKSDIIDVKDISTEIVSLDEQIEFNSEDAENVTQRLDLLFRLQHKHHKSSVEELMTLKEELKTRLQIADGMQDQLVSCTNEIQSLEKELVTLAGDLSKARHNVAGNFEKEIITMLHDLGMQQARFIIGFSNSDSPGPDGTDRIKFLFSSNKGLDVNEISKIASGGELSRLMLSIKSMISQKNLLPTIFFDEIDSGVSGEVAGKVGNILRNMGKRMQVIAITHLPQIAAKSDQHFWIYKKDNQDITTTYIKQLSKSEKIEEIAKMLSDNLVTPIALKNAKELLNN